MSGETEELKVAIRQLNARATKLKMDLHDLAEELPSNWEHIPDIAGQTHEAYAALAAARRRLAACAASE